MLFTRDNLLINGDNINGLQLLQGIQSYDLILIDPPKEGWVIKNWDTEFENRVELAYPLLKEDGAIAIFANDRDYPNVRLICDRIFKEKHYLNTFLLNKEQVVKENKKRLAQPFEFLIVYRKSEKFSYKEELVNTNMLNDPVYDEKGFQKYRMHDAKNVNTLKKILAMLTTSTSNILDFYAGSGSIGQAVLELNYEHRESRTFTLITHDEDNICSTICYPRIQKQAFIFDTLFEYLVIEDK